MYIIHLYTLGKSLECRWIAAIDIFQLPAITLYMKCPPKKQGVMDWSFLLDSQTYQQQV
jgi:hypothetical protein